MTTQDVTLGYLALPDAAGPGVVLIPDVWGLYDHYRDLARRLAAEGFATLAVDLYRELGGKPPIESPADAMQWIDGLDDPKILADLQAAVDLLAGHASVSGRVGIVGFCMGGQYALLAACSCRGISACAPFYGMVRYRAGLDPKKKPRSVLDALPDLTCPVQGFYGAEDTIVPVADVEALRRGIAAAGQPGDVILYPGAGHAFMNDTRPAMYREDAARDAWPRLVAFLRTRLAAAAHP